MFGYELADILLFDMETLKESYAGYLDEYRLVFWLGLAINFCSVYYIKKNLRVVYALLAFCWVFPGYFFFIREFAPIFWPSRYFGYLAVTMGLLLIFYVWKSRSPQPSSQNGHAQQKPLQRLPLGQMQLAFSGATLTLVLVTSMFSFGSGLALGTSATVAALATLSLFLFQNRWLARILCVVSMLWCLIMCTVVWALVYKI